MIWLILGLIAIIVIIRDVKTRYVRSSPERWGRHVLMNGSYIKERNNKRIKEIIGDNPRLKFALHDINRPNIVALLEDQESLAFLEAKEIHVGNWGAKEYEYDTTIVNTSELLGYEIKIDGDTIVQTQRGGQIGGAIVGGALLGGLGAIIGGLSSSKKEKKKIQRIVLEFHVDDLDVPTRYLECFDRKWHATDFDKETERVLKELEQWDAVLRTVLARNNKKQK